MEISSAHILSLANAYAEAVGVPLVTVSSRVFDDSKKLSAMEKGADITVRRYLSAVNWFADNWPDAAAWPHAVPRPVTAQPERAA